MSEPRIIAEVRSIDGWKGLLEAFRKGCDHMGASFAVIDDIAGYADGQTSKLLAPVPLKTFGPKTFGPFLGASALKILVAVDEDALASIRQHSRFKPRRIDAPSRHTSKNVRKAKAKRRKSRQLPSAMARMMRARQIVLTPAPRRSAIASIAAKTRWQRYRFLKNAAPAEIGLK